ncbi:ATP-dependent DNA helicase rep [Actinokineospora spheciospongiae]|uniref:ATP-dependent DNA helicase rep n=2 Tax=Actinokineospora spheciospongiae TaxID=909613 RepID=W7IHA6_9PSEU|nr:ATP-dependent DNA helicase rep [Actinokineospora spheciospongiae]
MSTEIGVEQEYVSMLYARLDGLRADSGARLARTLRETSSSPTAMTHRDAETAHHSAALAQYGAVENGLCFGRLDFADGGRGYIGRLGLFDESGDHEPLLMDWRAPASRPFYLATAASPDGVRRRRHIRTSRRRVTAVDDEVLDLTAGRDAHEGVTGEAALLSALNASRTGRMSDIVETIQAEQDEIIRSALNGVLVVQGGPGTGKTAVALHRAAFLLYTHREQLSRRGVLVIGPNATFLKYIGQVLPSLGETGVLLQTVGELYPGERGVRPEPARAAEIKGRLDAVEALRRAVRDRQVVPDEPMTLVVEREELTLDGPTVLAAQERARRSRKPHNAARPLFAEAVVAALTRQEAERLGADFLEEGDLADIRRELAADDEVRAAIEELWPLLTPQTLLSDLYACPDRLAVAFPDLREDERALLLRSPRLGWTAADAPLLDEAAELLGVDDRLERARAEQRRRDEQDYAQGVLDILQLEDEADPDILTAYDLIDASRLAERNDEEDHRTAAERAAADRDWTFGHVIVDEAQELSAMAWRVLMRRCPSRSMTLVGDVAQTGDLAGATAWSDVLGPYVEDRWRQTELTVNYRTPAEVMAVAASVLAELGTSLTPPSSVRETGADPWRVRTTDLAGTVAALAAEGSAHPGTLAVLVPESLVDQVGKAVAARLPDAAIGEHPELESQVAVLTVRQSKGLEFDGVLLVEPARVVAESPRGRNDLYVALTRATQRLGVVHTEPVPEALSAIAER